MPPPKKKKNEKENNSESIGFPVASEAAHGLAPLLPQFPQRVRGRAQRRGEDLQPT